MRNKLLKVDFGSNVSCDVDNPAPSSETCRIYRLPNPRQVIKEHNATEITARLLASAFPATSENGVCEKASAALGVSENTIRSILRIETVRIDARILLQSAAYCMTIGLDPMKVAGLKELYQQHCGGQ